MTFDEAYDILGNDEGFRATIYAMNTLLIEKGVYSVEEFQQLFVEHAINYQNGFRGIAKRDPQASREVAHANL